jgi:hypothetical protein
MYPPPAAPQYAAPAPEKKTNGLGIAALIIGILALVGAFIPFLNYGSGFIAFIGLVLGVIAIFLKGRSKGAAIAGAVISFVALILSIILAIVYTAGFAASVSSSYEEVQASNSAAAAVPVAVKYEITGDAPTIDARYSTYTNGSSGSESADGVPIPFVKEFTVPTGDDFDYKSFSLSGTTGAEPGSVTCRISIDGEVVSEQTSTGAYAYVSCSSSDFNGLDD